MKTIERLQGLGNTSKFLLFLIVLSIIAILAGLVIAGFINVIASGLAIWILWFFKTESAK